MTILRLCRREEELRSVLQVSSVFAIVMTINLSKRSEILIRSRNQRTLNSCRPRNCCQECFYSHWQTNGENVVASEISNPFMTEAISRDRQDNSKKKKFPANFKDSLMHHGSVSDKICSCTRNYVYLMARIDWSHRKLGKQRLRLKETENLLLKSKIDGVSGLLCNFAKTKQQQLWKG